jgi:hypothetical protein
VRPAWLLFPATAGTLLVALYPADGPMLAIRHTLSVLLPALLWFVMGCFWTRWRSASRGQKLSGSALAWRELREPRMRNEPRSNPEVSLFGMSTRHTAVAMDRRAADQVDFDLGHRMVARALGNPVFVGTVIEGVVEKMSADVPEKVADRLAREVMDSAGDCLAEAVAERIADAWQRAARVRNAAAGNGWTLRPRQRSAGPRGRDPKA